MSKMTAREIESAKIAARAAQDADRRNDAVARDRALRDLWGAAGYWLTPRTLTTAEFRGEAIPPKMIRMPAGRAVRWSTGQAKAMAAWAHSSLSLRNGPMKDRRTQGR